MKRIAILLMVMLCSCVIGESKITILGSATADFGEYDASEIRTATFTIKNNGDETLKIKRIRVTCGCSEGVVDKKNIPPGETTKLRCSIKGGEISGAYSKKIYILSNDPVNMLAEITLKGRAVPSLRILPKRELFINGQKYGTWRRSFTVETVRDGIEIVGITASSTDIEVKKILFTHKKIKIVLTITAKQGKHSKRQQFSYEIRIKTKGKTGKIRFDTIKLKGFYI